MKVHTKEFQCKARHEGILPRSPTQRNLSAKLHTMLYRYHMNALRVLYERFVRALMRDKVNSKHHVARPQGTKEDYKDYIYLIILLHFHYKEYYFMN